jgi:hypothetical protein
VISTTKFPDNYPRLAGHNSQGFYKSLETIDVTIYKSIQYIYLSNNHGNRRYRSACIADREVSYQFYSVSGHNI